MKGIVTGWVVLLAIVPAGSLLAHHSLADFDTTKPVRVKGTVVQVQLINPHSFIFLDEQGPDGRSRRWAIEGPSIFQLTRQGRAKDVVKPGDLVEVCGYAPREAIVWQIASPDHAAAQSIAGRLLNAELLVMPDGREQSWGDYHVHKCFPPANSD
jgi:hypothetical protein